MQRIGAYGLLAESLAEGDRLRSVAIPPSRSPPKTCAIPLTSIAASTTKSRPIVLAERHRLLGPKDRLVLPAADPVRRGECGQAIRDGDDVTDEPAEPDGFGRFASARSTSHQR